MSTTNPATGASAAQEPRQMACATSSPVSPTYMGFRLIELAPAVTRTDARLGWTGSRVVPLRRNWLAAATAIDTDASETVAVTPARPALGPGAAPARARWANAAASATSGGGTRITSTTLLCPAWTCRVGQLSGGEKTHLAGVWIAAWGSGGSVSLLPR